MPSAYKTFMEWCKEDESRKNNLNEELAKYGVTDVKGLLVSLAEYRKSSHERYNSEFTDFFPWIQSEKSYSNNQ